MSQKKLDSVYYEILKKCAASSENANLLLEQQSIKFLLTEKLDASDLKEVTDSLAKTRKSLVKLRTYADQLQMKTELQLMYDYIDSLEEALDKAQKQLADVSFDTGKLSGFFGKKISLPEITSASVKLGTRAVDFGRGFLESMSKIRSELLPIMKNVDKQSTLGDAIAADPDLDLDKISTGIYDILKKGLGGTMFKKVSNFFSKARIGKEAEIMSAPGLNIDMDILAKDIADELMGAKISNLLGEAPPPPPDESIITGLADEMKDAADAAEDNAAEGDPAEGDATNPEEVGQNLENAIRDEAQEVSSPLDSTHTALDAWVNSLSKSSQGAIKGAGRLDSLKGDIKASLENSAEGLEANVGSAIAAWVEEHQETLLKGKKFSKKNFDSLKSLIPKLASHMLKQTSEGKRFHLTHGQVRRFVFAYMDKNFKTNTLNEGRQLLRWQKLAGIK